MTSLRERPFDFQGGGGFEKNILALIFAKKIILASTQTKKNSLTIGMRKKITALPRDKKNQLVWTCIHVLDGPQIKDPIIFILHYIILHKLF